MEKKLSTECSKIECTVFDNLSHPVLVIDRDFNVLSSNKAACKMMNCNEAKGQKCYALTHNETQACWSKGELCPVKQSMESKVFSQAVHKHNYNGIEIFEEITATPVYDEKGELLYIIEELRDISKLLKLETVINSLRSEIKTLHGILPICASCKKVRDDDGYWSEVENYISSRSDALFSHSLCPSCLNDLYPEIAKRLDDKKRSDEDHKH